MLYGVWLDHRLGNIGSSEKALYKQDSPVQLCSPNFPIHLPPPLYTTESIDGRIIADEKALALNASVYRNM